MRRCSHSHRRLKAAVGFKKRFKTCRITSLTRNANTRGARRDAGAEFSDLRRLVLAGEAALIVSTLGRIVIGEVSFRWKKYSTILRSPHLP